MRRATFAALFAAGLAVLAVGCGTSSDSGDVPANSVAVVGDRAITKSEFDDLVKYAKRSYTAQKRPFPKVGTQEYAQIRDQAVRFLVQRAGPPSQRVDPVGTWPRDQGNDPISPPP